MVVGGGVSKAGKQAGKQVAVYNCNCRYLGTATVPHKTKRMKK